MQAPNGWISKDLLIWNELDRRGAISKGYVIDTPDLRQASDHTLDDFYQSVRQFLHSLDESTRCQIRWSVDSDYREELLAYKEVTDTRCEPSSWAAITRNERFNRYWQAMQSGGLRREKLLLFLSKKIDADPPVSTSRKGLEEHYQRLLSQYNEAFAQHGRVLASLFEGHGCGVTAMGTKDLYRHYATFFNPSYLHRDGYDPIGQFRRRKPSIRIAGTKGCKRGKTLGSIRTASTTIS